MKPDGLFPPKIEDTFLFGQTDLQKKCSHWESQKSDSSKYTHTTISGWLELDCSYVNGSKKKLNDC